MKYLNIKILFFLSFGFLVSCEDDKSNGFEFVESATVQVTVGERSFYDLLNISTSAIDLQLATDGLEVNSITVFKSYNGGPRVEHAVINTVPSTVEISLLDALNGLSITDTDLKLGDSFTFFFQANLANGTSAISKNVYVANLSCPSTLPEGLWTGVNVDASTFGGTSMNSEVMITSDGAGAYTVSDVSGAAYFTCCSGGGFTRDQPVTILDVCNEITVTSSNAQVTISTDLSNPGSWNPDTGILTINWCDDSNGFCSTTTFTKN